VPTGNDTSTTKKATTTEVHRDCHIVVSAHSAANHCSVVPCHGVTVGNRLVLNVAADITRSGMNR
jgi:hypothetical protein